MPLSKYLIKLIKHLKSIHKFNHLVLITSLCLVVFVVTAFYVQPVIKVAPTRQKSAKSQPKPPTTSSKKTTTQVASNPSPAVPVPAPAPAPVPAPVSQPVVKTTTQPAPAPAVTPAPNSSVPTLQPVSSTSTTSTTSSSTSSTSTQPTTSSTSTSSTSSSTSSTSSSTQTNPPASQYTSSNWSGYFSATSGTKYTAVYGSWTADSPTSSGSTTSYDGTWIGIGGITSTDLIQAGINNSVTSAGAITTQVFYETLPSPAKTIVGFKVLPGDTIIVSIVESATNSWTITIQDTTQKETYTNTVNYTSSLSSAEWIEEDPSQTNGQLYPLDNFGTVNFYQTTATANGSSNNLTQLNANSITMVNSTGATVAQPSVIGSDNASFSVQYKSS